MAMRFGFVMVNDWELVGFFTVAAAWTGLLPAFGSACAGVASAAQRAAPKSEAAMRAGMAKFERIINLSGWQIRSLIRSHSGRVVVKNNWLTAGNLCTGQTRRRIVKSKGPITPPAMGGAGKVAGCNAVTRQHWLRSGKTDSFNRPP